MPRELWIEATCSAPSFDQAIVDLTNAGARVLPAIAFCANAPIDDPEPELAFEIVDGGNEHQLFQRHVTQERGFPRTRRRAPGAALTSFLNCWLAHPDADRIYRALVQYSIALRYGAAGREILAHAHFYMAVESLTKALLRDECNRTKMTSDQLAHNWNVDKRQLDGEVRLRLVFKGDKPVYQAAKAASDGLEHGFANFDIIRSQAEAAIQKTATCVRAAIFELVGLPASARAALLEHPYGDPGPTPV